MKKFYKLNAKGGAPAIIEGQFKKLKGYKEFNEKKKPKELVDAEKEAEQNDEKKAVKFAFPYLLINRFIGGEKFNPLIVDLISQANILGFNSKSDIKSQSIIVNFPAVLYDNLDVSTLDLIKGYKQ